MPSERDKTSVVMTILAIIFVAVLFVWGAMNRYGPVVNQVKQAGADSDERNKVIEELAAP